MSTLDEQDLFGSGPHRICFGAWQRAFQRREFPGLDGELILDMGVRPREISQEGRLQAATAAALESLVNEIEELNDGRLHALVDNYGQVHNYVLVERFEPSTPFLRGRNLWCEYRLCYRQLP